MLMLMPTLAAGLLSGFGRADQVVDSVLGWIAYADCGGISARGGRQKVEKYSRVKHRWPGWFVTFCFVLFICFLTARFSFFFSFYLLLFLLSLMMGCGPADFASYRRLEASAVSFLLHSLLLSLPLPLFVIVD
ncbi:hypothetical protein H106_03511 [Trichophyton rubrum CBS 735.88]|nr:hypothetical protein H106_03511 [Trichophyton rubrum CBS 735.88]